MANYANLLAQIAANIYSNNNQDITGDILQLQLNAMVASLGAGYQFMGVAHPADTPSGYADLRSFWLAVDAGTYTNFGGFVLSDGEIAVIKYDGNGWSKDKVGTSADSLLVLNSGTNLYNKDSLLNRDNYRVQYSGDYGSLSGSSVSHPIKCTPGEQYCFKWSASYYGATANAIVRQCKADGELLSGAMSSTAVDNNAYGTFTCPNDWEYFCVNVRMSDKGVMIIAQSSTLHNYSPYIQPYLSIKPALLTPANPLYGKKAAFTGDSICYGAGASGGYAKIIGDRNGMTITNIAVSGGTICSGATDSYGNPRFAIGESVANLPDGYDYYIIEGGVNDAGGAIGPTLGAITPSFNSTFDTTTMCGAMESWCKNIQLLFKGKKYGFIFPHNVFGYDGVWTTSWRPAMKECLKKWGIPYLDLSDKCAQLRNLDALRIYTSNSDGWHPTEEGYLYYYVPKIEAWMKTL